MNGSLWNTHRLCQLFPPYFYSWTENTQKSSKKSDANDSKLKHAFKNQHEHQNKRSKEQAPFSEALVVGCAGAQESSAWGSPYLPPT